MSKTNTIQIQYTSDLIKSIYSKIKEEKASRGGLGFKDEQLTLSPYLGASEDYFEEYSLIKEWATITPYYLSIMRTLNFNPQALSVYFTLEKAYSTRKHDIEPLILGNFYTNERLLLRLQNFCFDNQVAIAPTINDVTTWGLEINPKLTLIVGTKGNISGWYIVNRHCVY